MTKAAVFFGRVITERRPAVTAVRDRLFRTACRLPGVGSFLCDAGWFPATAYRRGLLATRPGRRGARRAAGTHIPQPWILDQHGDRARLDDALGHAAWAVLHTGIIGPRPDLDRWRRAGVQVIELRPAGSDPGTGAVVDTRNQLRDWMRARRTAAIAVRPDAIVYAAAAAGKRLAAPPAGTMPPRRQAPAGAEVPALAARLPSPAGPGRRQPTYTASQHRGHHGPGRWAR